MIVRDATTSDLPAIVAIYNEVIATTDAIWAERPQSIDERAAWFEARRAQGYPVLVAADGPDGSDVVGFTSFTNFRDWPGYQFTVEHTIHVRDDRRHVGAGTLLLEALIARAVALGKHAIIAALDARNHGSWRFHRRLGFAEVGRLPEVGHRSGQWADLVLLQRLLGNDASVPSGARSRQP